MLLNALPRNRVFFVAPSVAEGAGPRALAVMFSRSCIASLMESVCGGTYSVFPVEVGSGAAGAAAWLVTVPGRLPSTSKERNSGFLFFFGEDPAAFGGELVEIS